MRRLAIVCGAILIGTLEVFAADDSKPANPQPEAKSTLAAVQGLIEQARNTRARENSRTITSALRSVQALADELQATDRELPDRAERPKPSGQVRHQAGGRARDAQARRRNQAQFVEPPNGFAPEVGTGFGFQPFAFAPVFFPLGGGGFFSPFGFSEPLFFRSGFAFDGFFPVFFGSGLFFPGPIIVSIGPPVTVMYDDPVERQMRMMIDGIRRSAERPPGPFGNRSGDGSAAASTSREGAAAGSGISSPSKTRLPMPRAKISDPKPGAVSDPIGQGLPPMPGHNKSGPAPRSPSPGRPFPPQIDPPPARSSNSSPFRPPRQLLPAPAPAVQPARSAPPATDRSLPLSQPKTNESKSNH